MTRRALLAHYGDLWSELARNGLASLGLSGGDTIDVDLDHPDLRGIAHGELPLALATCASAGAVTVWATDSIGQGVLAFLVSLAILGPLLWLYEKRRR